MKKLVATLLTLALLLGCTAALADSSRADIRFGDSIEDVMAKETLESTYVSDVMLTYALGEGTLIYDFDPSSEGVATGLAIRAYLSNHTTAEAAKQSFDALYAVFTSLYGDSMTDEEITALGFSTLSNGYAAWTLPADADTSAVVYLTWYEVAENEYIWGVSSILV